MILLRRLVLTLSVQIAIVACLYSQVSITGQVTKEGSSLSNVVLQVFENGKITRTVAANKRGKYQIDLPFNHEYIVVYRSPFMIPVSIRINTSYSTTTSQNVTIEVPVNMEMFNRYEDLDISSYDKPIGIVKRANNNPESFEFYPDVSVLKDVKIVNEKSKAYTEAGKKPIDTDDAEVKRMIRDIDTPTTAENSEASKPAVETSTTSKIEPTLDDFDEKTEATVDHYVNQEIATEAATEKLKTKQMVASESEYRRSSDQVEHIHESKMAKSEQLTIEKQREDDLLRARVIKQQALADALEDTPIVRQRTPVRRLPKSKASELGFFHSEEVLEVNYGQAVETYRHDTYDWLLFEVNYYYMGDAEISKNQYDQIRALFD